MKQKLRALVLAALAGVSITATAAETDFNVTTLTEGLTKPWGLDQLPDGSFLITEKPGQLRIWDGKSLSEPLAGTPDVYYAGQGGMLDVILHPNYAENGWLYLSYSQGSKNDNGTQVARAKLKDNALTDFEVLFTATPGKDTAHHFGGRMAFMPDNTLVFSVGEGYKFKEQAQQLDSGLGKIFRINDDGSIPADNPFVNTEGAIKAIYSYGHRNPQGLYYDNERGVLFENEHGPKGGDEVNIIKPGNNYGWPVITYGIDYSGAQITPYTEYEGMEQPFINWTPSIAPSALVVYQGEMFPQWQGDLLATTLKYQELRWVKMDGMKVTDQVTLLKDQNERLRDLDVAADGSVYIVTDGGKLLHISR